MTKPFFPLLPASKIPALSLTPWHPLETLHRERHRWVLWTPVFFGIGIAVYFGLRTEPPLWLGPCAVGLSLIGVLALRRRGSNPAGILMAALVAFGILAGGFSVAQWRTAAVAAPVLAKRMGPTTISGRITGVETFPGSIRVTLDRPRVAGLGAEATPERIRLRLRGRQPALMPGQWLRARAILSPPPPPAAPGAFDFQRQSYFRRLGAVGFNLGPVETFAGAGGSGWDFLTLGLARVRQAITARIHAGLDGRAGVVAAALMTGERSSIPGPLMDAMRDSGIAHLLAISGLHIGLVAAILFIGSRGLLALVAPLALHFPIKKWAAVVAIAGAFAYALIAGATVPTQRAFLMVGLMLLAVLADRRGLSVRLVAWAALIILILQPESLLGPSFQMSFAAVTALIAVYEGLRDRARTRDTDTGRLPPWARKAGFYVAGVALTTVIAGAATAPFAIYHFNRFADYGLAANLVAVPVTALWVMPWAVGAFLMMPLGLESLALVPMGWGVDVVIAVAETVSSWPGAVTLLPAMPTWALAAVALGGVWLCLWQQRWRYLGGAGIALGMAALFLVQPPDVLIEGRGRLLGVRTADGGLAVSNPRRARFDRDIWLRRLGQKRVRAAWPRNGASADGRLSCDVEGCVYRAGGRVVALAFGEAALAEDCWMADVVVSLVPVRISCPAPDGLIDRFDLWRLGGHALWLNGDKVRIETVNGVRGDRPWVIRPAVRPTPKPKGPRRPAGKMAAAF